MRELSKEIVAKGPDSSMISLLLDRIFHFKFCELVHPSDVPRQFFAAGKRRSLMCLRELLPSHDIFLLEALKKPPGGNFQHLIGKKSVPGCIEPQGLVFGHCECPR